MTLEELKNEVLKWVSTNDNFKTKKGRLIKILDTKENNGVLYWELDTDKFYFNIHIYLYGVEGCVRVYESHKDLKVQIMRPVTMNYSGISTFPSARKR